MQSAPSPVLIVLALWGAGLGAAGQFGKVSVVFDRFVLDYPQASPVSLGLTVSLVGFVGLVLGVAAGILAQRLGYRRILVAALWLGAALSALEASLPPLSILLPLRLAEGFSHLAIVVAAPVLIAQASSARHMGLSMSLWSSFLAVSFALTAWLGRPLAEAQGTGALFWFHAGYMAVFAGILWRLLPADQPEPGPRLSLSKLLQEHVTIYTSPRMAAPALAFFSYTLVYVALLTLLPPLIGGAYQALIATAMPLVTIAASMTLGVWLMRRFSAVAVVQLGFLGSILAGGLIWGLGGQGLPIVAAVLGLAGALGLVQGASFAAVAQLNAEAPARARAAGAIAQMGNLGTTTGTPLLVLLLSGFGMTGLLLFLLVPSLWGVVIHQILRHRRRLIAN
jgi:MFS transporter, DHA1 family, inner membrane transport protein